MAKQPKPFGSNLNLAVFRMIKDQGLSVQNVNDAMDIRPTAV